MGPYAFMYFAPSTCMILMMEAEVMSTRLVRRMRHGVLRDQARSVWRHVLEYLAQPLDNIVIIDFATGHPGRIFIARVLVPEGVASHQWLHPTLHETEGHVLGPQPGLSKGFDLFHQL
jgi:hypothetical protein